MAESFSPAEIEQYRREGFVEVESLFGQEDLRRVDRAIEELTQQALASGNYAQVLELEPESVGGEPVVRRIYNPYEQHQAFRDLASGPRVLDRVGCFVGPSIQLQHSKLNMKAARVGSPVEWHQDLSYFPHTNPDLVTVLIYLDEATTENGCLQVIPRQHHHFLECHDTEGRFAGMITEDMSRYDPAVPLEGPAGSVIFMHAMTPHSSLPNRSPFPRRTLIFEYRAADSFPIYFSPRVANSERYTHQLRGQPARFARLGGPPPLMPALLEDDKSLYQLQEETKKRLKR